KPRTVRGVIELLNVVMTILAHRELDPEHRMSDGPILEILRNAHEMLGYQPDVILTSRKDD
ncbi:MAG: hypothetical protein JWL93_2506, partial [Hyphomicrobiales bacterium]|nr:hypothetical protein [Hyphomicrobiales bacterium]